MATPGDTIERPRSDEPSVRDAAAADVAGLRAWFPQADHADRIAHADGVRLRYVVVELAGEVVGFGKLTMHDPPDRPPPAPRPLPRITNLNVREDMRGQGLGARLIRGMEQMARALGAEAVHIGASADAPRTLAWYQRLGYEVMADQPPPLPPRPGRPQSNSIYLAKRLT